MWPQPCQWGELRESGTEAASGVEGNTDNMVTVQNTPGLASGNARMAHAQGCGTGNHLMPRGPVIQTRDCHQPLQDGGRSGCTDSIAVPRTGRGRTRGHRDARLLWGGHTGRDKMLTASLVCIFYVFGCAYVATFLKNKSLLYNHKRQSKMTCILCWA